MISVRITFADGKDFTTEFNGSAHLAVDYYWDKVFVEEYEDGTEVRRRVCELTLIARV
jgi:hypothetical protein